MIHYSPEVADAIEKKLPVVGLESTIISFGMPYPQNLEVAKSVENIIRNKGAIPATIGLLAGKIHIGLTSEQLQFFAHSKNIEKCSTRDIPYILALEKNGATTVSATIECAQMSGIEVCVTGGLGGVHRGVTETLDISADLPSLQKNSIAIICSGVKSILDVAKTKEYLETIGVPVIGYQCEFFPLFFSHSSSYKVDYSVSNASEIAKILHIKQKMKLSGSLVIANPVPKDKEISEQEIENILKVAQQKMCERKIIGKQITPFLLSEIEKISKGKSLQANIALIENNARLGAEIAVEYNKLNQHGR